MESDELVPDTHWRNPLPIVHPVIPLENGLLSSDDSLSDRNDRIEKDGEIRTYGIITMRTERRSKMPTCGESHNAHIIRINLPTGRRIPDYFHSMLGITRRKCTSSMGQAVFQNKITDATLIEKISPRITFVGYGQMSISSSLTIYDSPS